MNQSNLFQKVRQFTREHNLLQNGEKVIVAVSGGIDSVTMLDLLQRLGESLSLTVAVAHFNHGLRGGESEEDEGFVRKVAANRGLACYVERTDTAAIADSRKLSIQEAARDVRYEFFSKLRASLAFDNVVTAHNADDNAETILLNVLRGTGVQGLSGIPVRREDISVVRPLLSSTRDEIEQYALERGLQYRVDSSNLRDDYTRNFLRNSIIPKLKEHVNPNIIGTLGHEGEIFTALGRFLADEARRFLGDVIVKKNPDETILDVGKLNAQQLFMQEYLLVLVARDFVSGDVHFTTMKELLKLCHAETGSSVTLGKDCTVFRNRSGLVFRRVGETRTFRHAVEPNKKYEFDGFQFSSSLVANGEYSPDDRKRRANGSSTGRPRPAGSVDPSGVVDRFVEYIDADRLGTHLVLRSWSDGDWFYPLGMTGKKKLSDFFIDEKIPVYDKKSFPVLESGGNIVWVCGNRLDHRFRITEKTRRILKLEFFRNPAA